MKINTLFKHSRKKHVIESIVLATTFSHLSGSIWIPRRKNNICFEAI